MTTKTTTLTAALKRAEVEHAEAQAELDAATEQHRAAAAARDSLLDRAGEGDPEVTPAMINDARTAVEMAAAVMNRRAKAVQSASATHHDAYADAFAAEVREKITTARVGHSARMEQLARYVMGEVADMSDRAWDYNIMFEELYSRCQVQRQVQTQHGFIQTINDPHPEMVKRGITAEKFGPEQTIQIDGDTYRRVAIPDVDGLASVIAHLEHQDAQLAA